MSEKKGLFSRLRDGLFKSREHMAVAMDAAVEPGRPIDEDFYDDLTDALILSDMGTACAMEAIDRLRERVQKEKLKESTQAKAALKEILVDMLDAEKAPLKWPMIILMVGVNGVGKTTTIGKLALRFFKAWGAPSPSARPIPSAPPRRISCKSGPSARAVPSCATRRGPIPPAWCSTASSPPRPTTPIC